MCYFKEVGLAIIEHNPKLNAVNNLQTRPAFKTINSCIDNPLKKELVFLGCFFLHSNTAYSNTPYLPTEFEESVLDCICIKDISSRKKLHRLTLHESMAVIKMVDERT